MDNTKFTRSSIRYPGAKSKQIKNIFEYFPEHIEEYRENFLGGGSCLFYVKQKHGNNIKKYWVNDLYYPLYCFWKILQQDPTNLHQIIKKLKDEHKDNGRDLYEIYKSDISYISEVDNAIKFFVLNKISFSGLLSGTYSAQAFDSNFSYRSIDNLLNMKNIIQNVNITNLGYEKLLDNDHKGVFCYLDPPYSHQGVFSKSLYGKNGELHKNFDFELFAERMKNCNAKYCISLDDSEYIFNLFKDFSYIYRIEVGNYSLNNNKTKRTEVLITNYNVKDKEQINDYKK